jgi:hypothetical protein
MERSRLVSLILMMISCMAVMMLVRACMSNAQEANNRNKSAGAPNDGPHIVENTVPAGLDSGAEDFAGSGVETEPEEPSEYIEYVTDLIGQVIETIPHTVAPAETEPEETTEDTRSILEKYNDEQASIAAENATAEEQTGAVFGGRDPQLTTEIVLVIG